MNTEFSVKRITDALAAVDKARNELDSAKATYKAKREILQEMQAALEDAIRAETSPAPLFDRPPSEVSFTAQVGQALRDGLKGTGLELVENPGQADDADEPTDSSEEVFPDPVTWNVYDAARRKDAGTVQACSYSEAKRLAHGHYPEVPEGACLVTRVKSEPAQPWTGAAAEPDAWRHQGVGLALRTLSVPTVQKLAAAGLATIGALADFAAEEPGEMRAIKGLGAKATADLYLALDDYLEARKEARPDAHDEDAE